MREIFNSEQITLFHLKTYLVSFLYLLSLAAASLHHLNSTAHAHASSTATTRSWVGWGRWVWTVQAACSLCLLLLTGGIADGLINWKDRAGSLGGSCENVDSYFLRFPDEGLVEVGDLAV